MRVKPPEIDPTHTVDTVAKYYLIGTDSDQMILRYIRLKKLNAIKVGQEYRIPLSSIKEFNQKYNKVTKRRKGIDF